MTDKNKRVSSLIALVLKDKGKTSIFDLAKKLGFTQKEAEREVPYFLVSVAKVAKKKSEEVKVVKLERKDVRGNIATVLNRVANKLIEKMTKQDFSLSEEFLKELKAFLLIHSEYAKFEGMNKADKLDVEIKKTIDVDKIDPEDAETIAFALTKARVKDDG